MAEDPLTEAHQSADQQPPADRIPGRDRPHRLRPEPEASAPRTVLYELLPEFFLQIAGYRLPIGLRQEQVEQEAGSARRNGSYSGSGNRDAVAASLVNVYTHNAVLPFRGS